MFGSNMLQLAIPLILVFMGLMVLVQSFNWLGALILIGIGAMIWYQAKEQEPLSDDEYELVKVIEE